MDRLEDPDRVEPTDFRVGIEQAEEGPILARRGQPTEEWRCCGERHAQFRLVAGEPQDPFGRSASLGLVEQARLADPGFAHEQQRGDASFAPCLGEQRSDRRQLVRPSDELLAHPDRLRLDGNPTEARQAAPPSRTIRSMYLDALEFLEEERDAWTPYEALAALDDATLARPVAAAHDWSGRDLMAHLLAWQEVALQIATELAINETSPTIARVDADWETRGGDVVNAELTEAWSARPMAELRESFRTQPGSSGAT